MAWNNIERVGPAGKAKVRDDGMRVSWRPVTKKGHNDGGYILIAIGATLAQQLGMVEPEHPIRLLLGSENDAGKMALQVDKGGTFIARGKPGGQYRIAIGPRSAAGRFATHFPEFERGPVEVLKPQNGPRYCAILLTSAFLDHGHG
ncbi:hypothetical protein [Sphingobium aquiterrae]|uniref:hypothetical protein n=1 Tax=Sphingobium aquiterrae TaxID=2038656 RepID=UPI003018AC6F